MKSCLLIILIFVGTCGYSQNESSLSNDKSLVFAIGVNGNTVEKYFCLGHDMDLQYLFNDGLDRVGFGFETMFGLNTKTFETYTTNPFTNQQQPLSLNIRYFEFAYKLEYNHYFQDPNYSVFASRVGIHAGLSLQTQAGDNFLSSSHPYGETDRIGAISGVLYGVEYTMNKFALYAELGCSYHYINKKIIIVDKHHQLGANIKFGVLFYLKKGFLNELSYRFL